MSIKPAPVASTATASRAKHRWDALPALILLAVLALMPYQARAQSCFVNGAAALDFGTVSAAGNTDALSNLAFACQSGEFPKHFRVCLFVGDGAPSGFNPRRMTNYNGAFMNYDLYSDAARTRLIGPLGSSAPLYSVSFSVPGGYTSVPGTFQLHGRVPAGQSLPAAFPYQSQPAGSVMRYSYGDLPPSENDCSTRSPGVGGGSGEVSIGWSGVKASFDNSCRVVVATDLDFGNATTLTGNRDQTSTIQLQCPARTAWKVGLDNGVNASGNTRRMASGGNLIRYELYRDSRRRRRWGNTNSTDVNGRGNNTVQALTVYGRVPAQANPAPGSYADTITVTLTY